MKVNAPLVGVKGCKQCDSVGTIVELGVCCYVAAMMGAGNWWEVPRTEAKDQLERRMRNATPRP